MIEEGVYRPPLVLKLSGGGNIDNDNIHTRENNVIGEGVGRNPPPPRVEVIGTQGISTTTYPIKNKKTKEEIKRGEEERNRREAMEEKKKKKRRRRKE